MIPCVLLKAITAVCVLSCKVLRGKHHPELSGIAVPEERKNNHEDNIFFLNSFNYFNLQLWKTSSESKNSEILGLAELGLQRGAFFSRHVSHVTSYIRGKIACRPAAAYCATVFLPPGRRGTLFAGVFIIPCADLVI